jgi:hypothetical protein
MRKYLVQFTLWLVRKLDLQMFHYVAFVEFIEAAFPLVLVENTKVDQSGEYRRHQVYAQMVKKFPWASKRDLALAIELAVRRL